jgi:hypothetical protein
MAIMAKAGGVMLFERGEPDFFYLNDGRGRFSAVSWTGGLFADAAGAALTQPPRDWALSVMFRDFNGDGAPDLYICNDFLLSPMRSGLMKAAAVFAPSLLGLPEYEYVLHGD